jgi:type IV pilus assembly protein PilP
MIRANRMLRSRALVLGIVALTAAPVLTACSDTPPPAPTRGGRPGSNRDRADREAAQAQDAPASGGARAGSAAAATTTTDNRPPPLPLSESDFSESDRTRDPFRSFAREFVPQGPVVQVDEHAIKLREYALDALQLVAVILGTDSPYAMVTDPTGRGTIIRRGEYVGRPDTVAGGDGLMPHQVPWRVARIVGSRVSRDADNNLTEVPGEVVFEREDRLNPNGGRAERVLSLAPGGNATRAQEGQGTTPQIPTIPGLNGTPFLPGAALGAPGTTSSTGGPPGGAPIPPGGATYVQSYTTVVPPQPAPPAQPTTVVIQTGPQGQVTGATGATGAPGASAPTQPTGPRDPYGPPGGANAGQGVPPVVITGGGGIGSTPMPTSGLGR